ncbi:MAG TPA: hypothetical protein VE987_16295 [Polyangiaceae bacterium]|nr:hypothetical protein [Polyangiaceae bacterium]
MSGDPGGHSNAWRRWAFAAIPAAGLLELAAHAVLARSVVPSRDWLAARDYVAAHAAAADLVAFAPRWADPIGRQLFGPELATVEREARPDETRFARAFEVSRGGAHLPAFAGWRRADQRRFGGVTVTTWDNPAPAHVIDDLVAAFGPERVRASQLQGKGEVGCSFVHTSTQSGGLGFGPAVPGDRFACPGGGFAAVSVVADLDYVPRRCVFAPPSGGPLRLRFTAVRFGRTLHGHHALYVEAERGRQGAPVALTFSVAEGVIGAVVHRDGEGWKPFEFDTAGLEGKQADLTVDVASNGERRLYCFEADTR